MWCPKKPGPAQIYACGVPEREHRVLVATVLFVTHDIDETILLADRICMMSARPGKITREIAVNLPRPRSIESLITPAFSAYKAKIMVEMRIAHTR